MSSSSPVKLDPAVREILDICKCLEFSKYFKGIKFKKLKKYTLEDLWTLLPGDAGHLVAAKIRKYFYDRKEARQDRNSPSPSPSPAAAAAELQQQPSRQVESDDNSDEPQPQLEVPTAAPNIGQQNDDSGDEYDEEEERMVFTSSQPVSKSVVEVSLSDSDDDDQNTSVAAATSSLNSGGVNQTTNGEEVAESQSSSSSSRYSFRQRGSNRPRKYEMHDLDDDDDNDDDDNDDNNFGTGEPTAKRVKTSSSLFSDTETFIQLRNPKKILNRLRRDPDFVDSCSSIQLVIPVEDDQMHMCEMDDPTDRESKLWQDFYTKVGPHIYSLELLVWTWRPVKSKCPYNLLKILTQYCPNLSELSLCVNPAQLESISFPKGVKLPRLKTLRINHAEELNYKTQLEGILKATINIETFKYSFSCLDDADSVLDIFRNFEKSHLNNLKSLSLRSYTKSGYLKERQLVKLSKIEAGNLQVLELGNGLWEDTGPPTIEEILYCFSKLKKLVIYGSFQGNSYETPKLTINIPSLPFLEVLDIGGNYEFGSIFESSHNLPPRIVNLEDDYEVKTDLFSVTLKLPFLPNLESIVLGNLFKIDELHFSSFPKLTSFRCGSPWHLSLKLPPEASRKFSYPLITELQLPDCLKDPSFVQQIPVRFPNILKCWIFLPSVPVLRSFFSAMASSNLKELQLKTQFDFESTMETCLLGRPTEALRSYADFMKLEDLKKYKFFQDFVSFHNIELPVEKVSELEEDNFAGLAALKSLSILNMEHIPRTLRIPTGNARWTSSDCQFTHDVIGFRQYPMSKKCLEQLPLKNLKRCTWPNFLVSSRDISKLIKHGFTDYKSDSDEDGPWDSSEPGTSSSKRKKNSKKGEKLKVQIQPAMLQALYKFMEKKEQT